MANPPEEHIAARLVWKDGMPVIMGIPERFTKVGAETRIKDLMKVALNLPYDGEDPRLKGLTKGEAMIVTMVDQASNGDKDVRTELLDRLIGKPQQNIKSMSLKGDLNDFLDGLEDPPAPDNGPIIDVEAGPGDLADEL